MEKVVICPHMSFYFLSTMPLPTQASTYSLNAFYLGFLTVHLLAEHFTFYCYVLLSSSSTSRPLTIYIFLPLFTIKEMLSSPVHLKRYDLLLIRIRKGKNKMEENKSEHYNIPQQLLFQSCLFPLQFVLSLENAGIAKKAFLFVCHLKTLLSISSQSRIDSVYFYF